MTPNAFDAFLSELLPHLGLCPSAHRRRNIRRRIARRMESGGIHEFPRYLELVRRDPMEREALRSLLGVTISRFFRNAKVFHLLSRDVLPRMAAKATPGAWSAGCAAGEEPYSLCIAWEELPGEKPSLRVIATDVDPVSLERAAAGCYRESSLREVPEALRRRYFERDGGTCRVREDVRHRVSFRRMDLLRDGAPGRFDLILCRNSAFTYFAADRRLAVARMFAASLNDGGWLVVGRTESLPEGAADLFEPAFPRERVYRLRAGMSGSPPPSCACPADT